MMEVCRMAAFFGIKADLNSFFSFFLETGTRVGLAVGRNVGHFYHATKMFNELDGRKKIDKNAFRI